MDICFVFKLFLAITEMIILYYSYLVTSCKKMFTVGGSLVVFGLYIFDTSKNNSVIYEDEVTLYICYVWRNLWGKESKNQFKLYGQLHGLFYLFVLLSL